MNDRESEHVPLMTGEDGALEEGSIEDCVCFMRRIKQWQSRGLQQPDAESMRAAFLRNGERFRKALTVLEEKRAEHVRSLTQQYDQCVRHASVTRSRLLQSVQHFLLEERDLRAEVDKASRSVKRATQRQEALRAAVIRIEEGRKDAFDMIGQPHWEVKHHFHMIALEHFRGNRQRQLMEIAEMFPDHLRVAAIAKQTSFIPQKVFPVFKESQQETQSVKQTLNTKSLLLNHTSGTREKFKSLLGLLEGSIEIDVDQHEHGGAFRRKYVHALNVQQNQGIYTTDDVEQVTEQLHRLLYDVDDLKKQRRKANEQLVLTKKTRAGFDAEMARLRLLKIDPLSEYMSKLTVEGSPRLHSMSPLRRRSLTPSRLDSKSHSSPSSPVFLVG